MGNQGKCLLLITHTDYALEGIYQDYVGCNSNDAYAAGAGNVDVDHRSDAGRGYSDWRRRQSDSGFDLDPGPDVFVRAACSRDLCCLPGHLSLGAAHFDHFHDDAAGGFFAVSKMTKSIGL